MSREKELSLSTAESLILPKLEFLRLERSQTFRPPVVQIWMERSKKGDLPKDTAR